MPLELRYLLFQLPRPNLHHLLFPSTLPANTSLHFHRIKTPHLLTRAASIGGSGAAEYPEQLMGGPESRRKRRSVAGVDQEELVDPTQLADPDSFFCEFHGVHIHHKICHHEERKEEDKPSIETQSDEGIGRLPMILLHGFGASVFSWNRVLRPLARITGSKVLAFDRPAFGLTSRASHLGQMPSGGLDCKQTMNPYSMAFSVIATLSFLDLLGAGKAILMGHSAGCLVAVNTYFEAPERVAALILIAPAIVAPLAFQKKAKEGRVGEANKMEDGGLSSDAGENPIVRVWKVIKGLCMRIIGLAMKALEGIRDLASSLYMKALSAILRSSFAVMLVRLVMDKFGILAVRNAWYDANQVTDHVIQGYTKPLRVKGWEMALLQYTLAMLTDSSSKSMPPLSRKLADISCPVLIITGDTDRLVPSWNAERLSRAIPGSTLDVIKNCGHLPHEERPEEFLSVIERFLRGTFLAQAGQPAHAMT